MTSAKERAVEAGARAFMSVYKDPCADPSDYYDEVRATLRAAFPILAEDAIEAIEADYAFTLEGPDPSYETKDPAAYEEALRTAELLRHAFASLRARIQQMAEAL